MTGEELKRARLKLGLTQSQFAQKIGIKRYGNVLEYEKGRRKIPKTVILLVELLLRK